MGWKTIFINSEQSLHIKNNNLIVKKNEEEISFALEDIDTLIIDNYKSIITVWTINELIKQNVCIIVNNIKHEPNAMILNLGGNYLPLENLNLQINLNDRLKQTLHKQIIMAKIQNQRKVLEDFDPQNLALFEKLKLFEKQVNQGDKGNREAIVAKLFFNELYGFSFIRFTDDGINNALNYGYKILASRISSGLVKYGLHPTLGVFHKTKTNYFNLTYDFIEPFRPLIDWIVSSNKDLINESLSIRLRIKLIDVLDYKIILDNKVVRVRNAIDLMIRSYISFLKNTSTTLLLPEIYLNFDKERIEERNEEGLFI